MEGSTACENALGFAPFALKWLEDRANLGDSRNRFRTRVIFLDSAIPFDKCISVSFRLTIGITIKYR